jgi:hypothetical protein
VIELLTLFFFRQMKKDSCAAVLSHCDAAFGDIVFDINRVKKVIGCLLT